jgi:aldose 1-epimerase
MAGMKPVLFLFLAAWLPSMSQAANYTAENIIVDGVEVIRLADAARQTEVRIAPSIGNNAYQMKVKGVDVMWMPQASLTEWKAKPAMGGNPFLAPWANRIAGDSYHANGKRYWLNGDLKNFRRDANQNPIHGLVVYASQWRVTTLSGGDEGAVTTSRLEFWRFADWMAHFPFAHTIEMTHRLRDGVLEVETLIENHASEPMPVSVGYHPYYRIGDAPRDDWQVHLAASQRVVLSDKLVPTGEIKPVTSMDRKLAGSQLDDVFTGLVRGADGRAVFTVQGKKQRIAVEYGPNYPVSVVYAPPGRDFICFEPMSGVTNAFNLAHEGKFPLQSITPGGQWRESFWVRPSGF